MVNNVGLLTRPFLVVLVSDFERVDVSDRALRVERLAVDEVGREFAIAVIAGRRDLVAVQLAFADQNVRCLALDFRLINFFRDIGIPARRFGLRDLSPSSHHAFETPKTFSGLFFQMS